MNVYKHFKGQLDWVYWCFSIPI